MSYNNGISQGVLVGYLEYKKQHPQGKTGGFFKWLKQQSKASTPGGKVGGHTEDR